MVAAIVWSTPLPRIGWGNAATIMVATPPTMSAMRPAQRAGRRPAPVTTSHRPTARRAAVITQRSVAPWAASALMVSRTGS